MINLRYLGEKIAYEILFESVSNNVVQIIGRFPIKEKGFLLFRDDVEDDPWDYLGYTTVYREVEGGAQFSNDGSVYTPPVPIVTFMAGFGGIIDGEKSQAASRYEDLSVPVPVPEENYEFVGWEPEIPATGTIDDNVGFQAKFIYMETLEEVKTRKILEMNTAQQNIVGNGIDVTFSDGRTEHFGLTEYEQKRLMVLQARVAAGDNKIPWHTSNLDDPCRYYTNAEMMQIINAAMAYATYHETYFRDIRRYINSLEDKESMEAVTYGMVIPEEYRSEVLTDMYAAQEAQQEV